MARYEHLPICKSALDLTVHFEKLVAGFSRYHRYTLGTELRAGSRAVLMQVLRANQAGNAPARCAELLVLRDRIDALLMRAENRKFKGTFFLPKAPVDALGHPLMRSLGSALDC